MDEVPFRRLSIHTHRKRRQTSHISDLKTIHGELTSGPLDEIDENYLALPAIDIDKPWSACKRPNVCRDTIVLPARDPHPAIRGIKGDKTSFADCLCAPQKICALQKNIRDVSHLDRPNIALKFRVFLPR